MRKNKKIIMAGITAVVAATSLPLIYGSFQIRAYSMLMLFAALTFYFWIKRKFKLFNRYTAGSYQIKGYGK